MAESVSLTKSVRIEWRIKNIFSVKKLESERFKFSASQWRFELLRKAENWIAMCLNRTHSDKASSCKFKIRVFIEDKDRKPQFESALHEWPHLTYVWSCSMRDLRRKENLWTEGVVTFVCRLVPEPTVENYTEKEKEPVHHLSTNAAPEAKMDRLTVDLRHLLLDRATSDLTLKCGDRTIPAHRYILSACSEVFAALLSSDMIESRSGVIEITDMDPSILEQLVQFMYCSRLPDLSMDTAPELYAAGDKYAVEPLKRQCSAFMQQNMDEEYACNILLVADLHSDRDLKECAVSFILKANVFQREDIWLKFCEHHPKLAVGILNRVCRTRLRRGS